MASPACVLAEDDGKALEAEIEETSQPAELPSSLSMEEDHQADLHTASGSSGMGGMKRQTPVYLSTRAGSKSTAARGSQSTSKQAFAELLRKLQEEHERLLSSAQDELQRTNGRLREENSRLRAEIQRAHTEVPPVSEVSPASGTSQSSMVAQASRPEAFHSGSPASAFRRVPGRELYNTVTSIMSSAISRSPPQEQTQEQKIERLLNLPSQDSASTRREAEDQKRSWDKRPDGNARRSSVQSLDPALGRVEFSRLLGTQPHHTWMISPVSHLRLGWDFTVIAILLVDLWFTPVELVFMAEQIVPQWLVILSHILTALFVVDILFNFNTGFIDKDKLVMQRIPSIKKYLTTWFPIDVMATVPWDVVVTFLLSSFDGGVLGMARLARFMKVSKVMKTLRFLKMLRAIKLVRQMSQANQFFESFEPITYFLRLVQLLGALGYLAHFHGCIWGLLMPDMANQHNVGDAFHNYLRSFRWAYNAITIGEMGYEEMNAGIWVLELCIASERILLAMFVGGWGIVKALTMFQEDIHLTLVRNAAVRFFRQHQVSIETQISVMYSLHETRAAQKMQRHFKSLMSEHLPDELRRTVSEELWVPHLVSLGLILEISMWHQDFVQELSLIVREEVVASKTVLCKQGHASIAAYYILKGRLMVLSSHSHGAMPDFTDGMWVEEMALVNPVRRRTSTIITPTLSRLLTVPTQDFHELVRTLGLEEQFQEFRDGKLACGLCGRCGDVGDHFTHACSEARSQISAAKRSRRLSKGTLSLLRMQTQGRMSGIDKEAGAQTLTAFLHAHRLTELGPLLEDQQIHTRSDLQELDVDRLQQQTTGKPELRRQLSLLTALVQDDQEQAAFHVSSKMVSAQHLAFLSHYKLESGTEAALMRAELERVLLEDTESLAHNLTTPIFLDSEDLSDLAELQEHVRLSHNLVLLLTKDVLQRPWVLVEIVTAINTEVKVLPVEVNRKGAGFQFPDEDYYSQLVAGKVLDAASEALLRERGIGLGDVEKALRDVFNKIALPYSPHRSESIRMAEIKAIYKQLVFRGEREMAANLEGGVTPVLASRSKWSV